MATFTRLKSGSWRVQVRRKGKYVNDTFRRRKDAEEWALEIERRIDRGEPALPCGGRDAKTLGDLIRLHQEDLREVGKSIGRSKAASLARLGRRLGRVRLGDLDRQRIIDFGKSRARGSGSRHGGYRKLTKRCVDAATPRASEYFLWDDELPGFGLRVFRSGKRSYLVQYRAGGRTRRVTIGLHGVWTPEEARREARAFAGPHRERREPC